MSQTIKGKEHRQQQDETKIYGLEAFHTPSLDPYAGCRLNSSSRTAFAGSCRLGRIVVDWSGLTPPAQIADGRRGRGTGGNPSRGVTPPSPSIWEVKCAIFGWKCVREAIEGHARLSACAFKPSPMLSIPPSPGVIVPPHLRYTRTPLHSPLIA